MPDAAGREAARRVMARVDGLGPEDLVLCLISGGGSALLVQPAPGISLEDKQAVTRALPRSGAAIDDMNAVRKHPPGITGGSPAPAADPARSGPPARPALPGGAPKEK